MDLACFLIEEIMDNVRVFCRVSYKIMDNVRVFRRIFYKIIYNIRVFRSVSYKISYKIYLKLINPLTLNRCRNKLFDKNNNIQIFLQGIGRNKNLFCFNTQFFISKLGIDEMIICSTTNSTLLCFGWTWLFWFGIVVIHLL